MELVTSEKIESIEDIKPEVLDAVNDTTKQMVEGVYTQYKISLANFKKNLFKLKSGRSKIRLLNLLMEYPLNDEKLKAHNDVEKELFVYASNVLECKFLLLQYGYFMNSEEILKQVGEDKPLEEKKGENDGK